MNPYNYTISGRRILKSKARYELKRRRVNISLTLEEFARLEKAAIENGCFRVTSQPNHATGKRSKNPTPEGPALETPGRGYNALTPEGARLSCP